MANVHFLRKLASDELYDTLFFATGVVPVKQKSKDFVVLTAPEFTVKITTIKNILVNGDKCKSIGEAKYAIQDLLQ